jgi:hypothetical protein
MRDIKREVEVVSEWMRNPPKELKSKTDLIVCDHAIQMLKYKSIYPGLSKVETRNLKILKNLAFPEK